MCEALQVAPVHCANNLRRPPLQVRVQYLPIVWTRFKDVPQGPALDIVHNEIQVRRCLEGA